jgi:hypothetical protein
MCNAFFAGMTQSLIGTRLNSLRAKVALCEAKKLADGEPAATDLSDWALRYRFMNPGTNLPLLEYTYAEDAPAHDIVP